ncbi:hypothetical protein AVDCRST_MAG81-3059 [uncultured Synechococcales cyanobacterium]|uniref:Uncharacterized protein n=1 Tax=uncultured Synechococcales cyanobacterium TaxID=1936017 RepID=A0A6J4VLT7_9CYAN|nr:hypothetical protein AVDCRST_MAG81-3059 [uncultured Synechococcales cyanobacterium]
MDLDFLLAKYLPSLLMIAVMMELGSLNQFNCLGVVILALRGQGWYRL